MESSGKSKVTLQAPAKVNLRLKITGRRSDGYHDLDMVMVPLDLADTLDMEIDGSAGEDRFESDRSELKSDPSNTILKAIRLVREESGRRFRVSVRLSKRIPVAAGLGGGSSDAASTLIGLDSLLDLGWDAIRLGQLGVRIGADVPFFLATGAKRVTGIGERLETITVPPLSVILINPGFPVSTREAYRWFDEIPPSPPLSKGGRGDLDRLTTKSLLASFPPLENDLERVVIPRYPVLASIKKSLIEAGALGALMSGSGPTVFGLFNSLEARDRGYEKILKNTNWWVWKGSSL